MRKILIILTLFIIPVLMYSQQSRFDYIEGEVSIKRASGELLEAQINDYLYVGDSVITGFDGFAELSLESSSTITIDSDTVFVFSQKEKKGEKKSIFMIVLGKIGFRFDKLLNEPDIQTPATVAGIRGTDFTVVSALDGSAMYIVEDGSVAVEAEGSLIVLTTEEGVQVPIGDVPGEKYEVKKGSVDYSGWLEEGNKQFENDPAGVLAGLTSKLIEYTEEAKFYLRNYDETTEKIDIVRKEMATIGEEKGDIAKSDYFKENVRPLQSFATNSAMNYRYFGLSALSLRRFVISSMYIEMKTKYILDNENESFLSFIKEYEKFLHIYETEITRTLVESDI